MRHIGTERRNAGLCIDCGTPAARSIKRVRARAELDARESGLPLARFLYEALCPDCAAKRRANRAAAEARKAKTRESKRAYMARKSRAREEAGLCIQCGKQPPLEWRKSCPACLELARISSVRRYRAREAAGLCTTCGKRPPTERRKMCAPCRQKDAHHGRNYRRRKALTAGNSPPAVP